MKDLDFIDQFFDDINDKQLLRERIIKVKNDVLMEEPCPLYEPNDDEWLANERWPIRVA